MKSKVCLVIEDIDLGYHVLAICKKKENAERWLENHLNELRMERKNTLIEVYGESEFGAMLIVNEERFGDFFIEEREIDDE